MTVSYYSWVITENCHWLVNDNFEAVIWKVSLTIQWQFWSHPWIVLGISYHRKLSLTGQWQFWISLLIMSLTGQWQIFRQSHLELVNGQAENHWLFILVMDIPLMDKCHWPQSMTKIYGQNFKKMSLTLVNDKTNCHWLKVFYVLVKIARQRFRKHSTFYSDACCLKWKKMDIWVST